MLKVQVDVLNTLKFQDVPLYAIVAVCRNSETVLGMKTDDAFIQWYNQTLYVKPTEVVTLINLMVTEPKCTPPVLVICGMEFGQDELNPSQGLKVDFTQYV